MLTNAGPGLWATPAGKSAYVYQGVCQGKDIRLIIGSTGAWCIEQARDKATTLPRMSGRRGGGNNLLQPGPLAALMALALRDLDQPTIAPCLQMMLLTGARPGVQGHKPSATVEKHCKVRPVGCAW